MPGSDYYKCGFQLLDSTRSARLAMQRDNQTDNDAYDILDNKVEIFVQRFVEIFEDGVKRYFDEATGAVEKSSKCCRALGGLGSGIGYAAGVAVGAPGPVTQLGGFVGDKVGQFLGSNHHKAKAGKIIEIMHPVIYDRDEKLKFRELLTHAGLEIFQCFEQQFIKVSSCISWKIAIKKLAQDAVGRIMNYFYEYEGTADISKDLLTKGFVLGNSKGFIGTLKAPITVNNDSMAQVYDKVGLVTLKKDGTCDKFFKKRDGSSSTDKFGHRLLFDWEVANKLELRKKLNCEYREVKPPKKEHSYVLKMKDSKKISSAILHKINSEDRDLIPVRIEDNISRVNADICGLQENQDKSIEILGENHEILEKVERNQVELKRGIDETKELIRAAVQESSVERDKGIRFEVRIPLALFVALSPGRLDTLERVARAIQQGSIVIVHGRSGVGKSEIAITHANLRSRDYHDNIVWINAATGQSLKKSFFTLIKDYLEINTKNEHGEDKGIKSIINAVYTYFVSRKSLFIFDNSPSYEAVKEYLPLYLPTESSNPSILITSTNCSGWANPMFPTEILRVDCFTPAEASQFVRKSLSIDDESSEVTESINALASKLDYLPLHLQVAVSYIKEARITNESFNICDYLQIYEEKLASSQSGRDATSRATFNLSLDRISQDVRGRETLKISNIIAFLAPDPLDERSFLDLLCEEGNSDTDIYILKKYSIVKEGSIVMNDLMQGLIRSDVRERGQEEDVLRQALTLFQKCLDSRVKLVKFRAHIMSVWSYAIKYDALIDEFIFRDIGKGITYTTFFHLICQSGNEEIVSRILERAGEPTRVESLMDAKDGRGMTGLHCAAEEGSEAVVRSLIKRAKSDSVHHRTWEIDRIHLTETRNKFTPLHLASLNGHTAAVKALLEGGENINFQSSKGSTALHLAAENGHLKTVIALINASPDVTIKNDDGFTASQIASGKDCLAIKNYIRQQRIYDIMSTDTSRYLFNNNSLLIILPLVSWEKGNKFTLATNMTDSDFDHILFKCEDTNSKRSNMYIFPIDAGEDNVEKNKALLEGKAPYCEPCGSHDPDFMHFKDSLGHSQLLGPFSFDKGTVTHHKNAKVSVEGICSESCEELYSKIMRCFTLYFEAKRGQLDEIFNCDVIYHVIDSRCPPESRQQFLELITIDAENCGIIDLPRSDLCYYKLKTNGVHCHDIFKLLKNSSDCRKLAKTLVRYIYMGTFTDDSLYTRQLILGKYCKPLTEEVIEEINEASPGISTPRKGKLRESFLNGDSSLRKTLFEELRWKFTGKSDNDIKLELSDKIFLLPKDLCDPVIENNKDGELLPADHTDEEIHAFLHKSIIILCNQNRSYQKPFWQTISRDDTFLLNFLKTKLRPSFGVNELLVVPVLSELKVKLIHWLFEGSCLITENSKLLSDSLGTCFKFNVKSPADMFTQRKEVLLLRDKLLAFEKAVISPCKSVAGCPSSGVGKTQLAREYAAQYSSSYDNNIIWINARSSLTIFESFRKFSQDRLGIETINSMATFKSKTYSFFKEKMRKCLFIYEDADEETVNTLHKYTEVSCDRHALFISSFHSEESFCLELNVFSQEESLEFMGNSLKNATEVEMVRMAQELLGLPLALRLAVSYINMENIGSPDHSFDRVIFSVGDYLELLQTTIHDSCVQGENDSYGLLVRMWTLTVQRISKEEFGEDALIILNAMAYLDCDDVPLEEIFYSSHNCTRLKEGTKLLEDYSLITVHNGMPSIHGLLQKITRMQLRESHRVLQNLYQLIALKYSAESFNDRSLANKLLPHLEAFLSNVDQSEDCTFIDKSQLKHLLVIMVQGYSAVGNSVRKVQILKRMLRIQEVCGCCDEADLLVDTSIAFAQLGKFEKSLHYMVRAMKTTRLLIKNRVNKMLIFDGIRKAALIIANASNDSKHLEQIREIVQCVLNMYTSVDESYDLDVAKTLVCLGDIAYISSLKLIDSNRNKTKTKTDSTGIITLNLIGSKDLFFEALQIYERVDHDGPYIAEILIRIGYCHNGLRGSMQQMQCLKRALDIRLTHFGPFSIEVARTLLNMAVVRNILLDQGSPISSSWRSDHSISLIHLGKHMDRSCQFLLRRTRPDLFIKFPEIRGDLFQRAFTIFEFHNVDPLSSMEEIMKHQINWGRENDMILTALNFGTHISSDAKIPRSIYDSQEPCVMS